MKFTPTPLVQFQTIQFDPSLDKQRKLFKLVELSSETYQKLFADKTLRYRIRVGLDRRKKPPKVTCGGV